MSRLHHKSIFATYGLISNENSSSNKNQYLNNDKRYLPLRQHGEQERPRSIRLKPQEYLLFIVAILAISVLVIYNLYQSYFD
ncbi:unnamed protein product [Rotaria sp. Silwood2]|nr:unnamed protein product [Rotaria sp. Silwood2]CAF2627406.1 unnamed protein product [Rotaria sp. Silwood2]CAF2836845.1 unnamed protein product [Rotaria sp. Silwood2]CAF2995206.1 unnamed protein product [Rotaria sp. Silwood2]CAF3951728.1 unnamed protein product [Rotaria sp. Silwood2]